MIQKQFLTNQSYRSEQIRLQNMLDITSFRRKQKCVAPLTVMREFYYDYTYTSSSKNRLKSCTDVDPLAKKTLSIEKFNKCLRELQINNPRESVGDITNQSQKTSAKKVSLRGKNYSVKKQSGCFKSVFSTSIPFLKCQESVKDMTEHCREIAEQKQNSRKPEIVNILFSRRKLQIRNPTRQYNQMCAEKQKMNEKSLAKKQRLRRIREGELITNLYHKAEEDTQNTTRARYRIRELFSTTQERIFPQGLN